MIKYCATHYTQWWCPRYPLCPRSPCVIVICQLDFILTASLLQEAIVSGDSFMRVLLTVEPIQTAVVELLLLKMTDESLQVERIDRLILSQFRWYAS